MREYPRPVLVLSRCLEIAACRYDGQKIADPLVRAMAPFVEFRPVCPEVEIGLGVPRDPVSVVQDRSGRRLVQPSTGEDLTRKMRAFSRSFLTELGDADGFLLKSRSPSCALKDSKWFHTSEKRSPAGGKGPGLFGEEVLSRYAGLALEDEARIGGDEEIRSHFFTKLFTLADWRAVRRSPSTAGITGFHARNKLLFMAYHQDRMRALGRLAAGPGRRGAAETAEEYGAGLSEILSKPMRRPSAINALQHAFGYFSEALSAAEKRHFLALLDRYRQQRTSWRELGVLMRSWLLRFDVPYLSLQTFFDPYPDALDEVPFR